MKRPFQSFMSRMARSRLPMFFYTLLILMLVALSLFQMYNIWSRLDYSSEKIISGTAEPDMQATLMEPAELYLTEEGEQFAQLTALSGSYRQIWLVTRTLLTRISNQTPTAELIAEEDLPKSMPGLILRYACPLESVAIRENLNLELENLSITEIWLQPAGYRKDHPRIYLMDWEHDKIYLVTSQVSGESRSSRNFNEIFWDLAGQLEYDCLNAHIRFPDVFGGGVYIRKPEGGTLNYIPQIRLSFIGEDGTLDSRSAYNYCMHFFTHPDVAKPVQSGDDFLWYADEKRTVRYDTTGLLQYVATQEVSEKTPLTLSEAYQLATGFLKEDLHQDPMLLQELVLSRYTAENNTYTFCWNYCYNHIPFSMSEDTRLWTELDYPVEVVVEGSQVRYYHRYMLEKSMEADQIFTVRDSYIEALDMFMEEEATLSSDIDSFGLEYAEINGRLQLSWSLVTRDGKRSLRAREVRV